MSSHHAKKDTSSKTSNPGHIVGQQEVASRKSLSNDGLQRQSQRNSTFPSGGSSATVTSPSGQGQSSNNGSSSGGGGVSAFSYFKARLFGTVADASTSLTSSARDLLQPKKNPGNVILPTSHDDGVSSAPTTTTSAAAAALPPDPPLSPTSSRFFSRTLPSRRQPQPEPLQFTSGKQAKPDSSTGHPTSSASESFSFTPTTASTSMVQQAGHGRRSFSTAQSPTSAQKHLSTGSLIYQEGYLNKKVDLHSGETGHGWKVYRVALKSSKLYFYKPTASDERPQFHGPKDHRHYLSPNHSHRDHQGYHHPQHSSSSGILSPRLSITNECGMVLSAFNFESSTRTLLFEGNAKSLENGAHTFAPPVTKYVYGECFTEIDRLTMQFKKHVALLLFEDSIVICKRKWMRYASTKVKDVIKFTSNSNEKSETQEQASRKRQGSMSGISHKSADSRGSEGEQRTRNTLDQPTEKQRGYFTKWKHEATYPLSQVEALDMASPIPTASTFFPFAAPASATSATFPHIGRHQSDDTSSVHTIPSYTHQTTSTIELVVTSVIDGNEYTHRLLYLPPSQEVRQQWYSKFNRVKELDQSHACAASKGRGSVDNLLLKDTLSPRSTHSNHSTISLHSPTTARFHSEDGNFVFNTRKMDRTRAFNETSMHPELTFQLDDASGTERLAGASINGLIHEIVHGNITNPHLNLVVMFARTYPLFTTLSHVLKELKRCICLQPSTVSKKNKERMTLRVESLVEEMLKGLDARSTELSALEELRTFTEDVLREKLCSTAAPDTLKTITIVLEGFDVESEDYFAENPVLAQPTEVPVDLSHVLITGLTPAVFLKLDPSYFAEQVLRYHRDQLLIAGGSSSLLNNPAFFMRQYPTAGANRSQQSPIAFSMYSPHFLTVLITHHILIATQSMQSTSRRPKLLTHWIRTAQCCRALGDMAGFVAIAIGICSPGAVRLQESWKHVHSDLRLEVAHTWVPLLIKTNMITEDMQWDPLESTCRHASLSIL